MAAASALVRSTHHVEEADGTLPCEIGPALIHVNRNPGKEGTAFGSIFI